MVNNFKIGSLFKYKDTLSKGMRSEVIYKYCCPSCGSCYVGSTIRNLATRVSEHIGVSVRTGIELTTPSQSYIREHLYSCNGGNITLDNFNILGTCENQTDLRITESLYIHTLKPSLNSSQSAYPLSIVNK